MPLLSPSIVVPMSALIGLLVGSFLATLVLRLPKREPIVLARSACPKCGHALGPAELVPVLSWLLQKRRCRACGEAISAFYPAMEIASAIVAATAAWFAPWPVFPALWFAGWIALCLAAWALRAIL
ncbi:MAG TPA: prepilin peptidase [Rhizomicrobium sp.]|nr:prepilin peptidase [Rhizomicrobium sp.]